MSTKKIDELREVLNAACDVVTAPTIAAYKAGSYEKRVPRPRMKRLIKALINSGAFTEEYQQTLIQRLRAVEAAEQRSREWAEGEEERVQQRRAAVDAQRHPFTAKEGPGYMLCTVCNSTISSTLHYDRQGNLLTND